MGLFARSRSNRILFVALALACALAAPLVAQKAQAPAKGANAPAARAGSRERLVQALPPPGRRTPDSQEPDVFAPRGRVEDQDAAPADGRRRPREHRLRRADSFDGDLRGLPQTRPVRAERPEREGPEPNPVAIDLGAGAASAPAAATPAPSISVSAVAAPLPSANFDGLDFAGWGNGHPPDTNGDVGPAYFIQSINTSLGVFDKATGTRLAAFSFNTFMSQGHFGNVCDTNNFGDPVVLYDTFEDRWVVTDFAFVLSGGNVVPPALQCFAVSKSGDPIAGGWNFYSIETLGGLGDYPKFGIWPDGIYMSANVFGYASGAPFQNPRVFALNKAQMYAGAASVQVVSFDAPSADFTLLPSNARLQTGTPAAGTPNFFVSTWEFLNALTVYKFHVDWDHVSLSTLTGPDTPVAATSWPNATVPNALSLGGNALDVLQIRAMMQNQYTNLGGVESLWATHTVRRADVNGLAAPRWYQVNITGGAVAPNLVQATTWDPDGANVLSRFMPSMAINRQGDLAMGYSTSSSTTKPAIKYAGRLAGDPPNTFSQTEQTLIQGTGTQVGNCGGAACIRWGDYSAMTLDPDGCTFWYTNMYYAADGLNHQTRIGSFAFQGCSTIGTGVLQGTVATGASAPLAGALVALGSRTTTTDASGFYSFTGLPAGTYPLVTASFPGFTPQSFTGIVVPDGGSATRNFTLTAAATAGCFVDTTQADFQAGVPANCDLTGTPGSVTLLDPGPVINQQNTSVSTSGAVFNNTSWAGQTFTPSASGMLTRVDLELFCSGCATLTSPPDVTISLRATNGSVPIGADLGAVTIPGFTSGFGVFYTAQFVTPIPVTAGTRYAIVLRSVSAPSVGLYAYVVSGTTNPYANGQRVSSANSGSTWAVDTTRDLGFHVYVSSGFSPSGTYLSSAKDANPANGATPTWGNLAWAGTVPLGTTLTLQAAASDSPTGPFTFVGPDGTAATTFTSGQPLSQFNGKRYLKYRATFATTNTAVTPSLDEVTICFADQPAVTSLSVDPVSSVFGGGATTLSATLSTGTGGLGGKPIAFKLNGIDAGTATTNAVGVATLTGVSLAGINAGSYPSGVTASFAGEAGYTSSTASAALTIAKAAQTITFDPLPDRVATDPPFTLSATGGDSGSPVVFSTASTACSVSGNIVTLLAAGSCAIDADQAGTVNYEAAPTVTQSFNIGFAAQVITFAPLPSRLATDPPFTLSATGGGSGNPVVFSTSSTACSVSGNTVTLLVAGPCAIDANQAGDAKYSAAPTVTQSFSIGLGGQTITFAALPAKTYGALDFTVTATATSGLPVAFAAAGQCTVTGALVHLTGAGSCSMTASQPGNATYAAAPNVTQTFPIGVASLTVKADDKVKVLNAPLPPFTGTLTGVVPPDNITATYSTTATALSPIGAYPITPSLVDPGNRLSNYSVSSVSGVLSIVFAPPGPCLGGPGHQVLPPIKTDGSSVFKPNTKIDVAFRVCDAHGIPIWWMDVVRSFKLVKIVKNGRERNVSIDLEGDSDDHDRHGRHPHDFRFDFDDLAWEFHLNTKVLDDEGTYYFRITLNDGSAIDFSFTLMKNGRDHDDDRDQ